MGALDTTLSVGDLRVGNGLASLQVWTDPDSIDQTNPNNSIFTPATGPNFIPALNEVCQRVDKVGLWKGVTYEIWFNGCTTGILTLPRRALVAKGAVVGGGWGGVNFFTEYNQFKYMGMGIAKKGSFCMPRAWVDLQDGWCTQTDIDPRNPDYIQIAVNSGADAGKSVWILGRGTDGKYVYDTTGPRTGNLGFELVTTYPNPVQSPVKLMSVEKVSTLGVRMLYPWSMTSGGVTLGDYEPGETNPSYRRYKLAPTTAPIKVFAVRRIVNLFAETDPVIPGCYGAIKFGLQALVQEAGQNDKAATAHWDSARVELDLEIKQARGNPSLSFSWNPGPRTLPQWSR